ncbi:MAG: CoA-binding protein [Thermodesulfobacteriota bacterium]
MFKPRSVAVIGASGVPFKWGNDIIRTMQEDGYGGTIYPINPREKTILGLPVYRSVVEVPDPIDLAVITVRAEQVPQALRECTQKGIKGAVLISAGFAETGSQGQALQEEVSRLSRQGGIRFVGPNCMGIFSAAANLNLSLPTGVPKGSVGFISQSGTFGGIFARAAAVRGCGLSCFISAGNQADLEVADYLEYLAEDPETKVVAMYIEGLKDGKRLFEVGRKIAGKKPVLIYKAGKNQSVSRVTMSHTASIAGEDRIFDAMCRQAGFIRVEELFSLLDGAAILTRLPLPGGKRIGILGTGGLCVVLADTCVSMGMEVPELKEEHMKFIISDLAFPPHAPAPRNPVDFAGSNRTALQETGVLNKLARLDYIDGLICNTPLTWADSSQSSDAEQERLQDQAAELLTAIPQKIGKPVVTVGLNDIAFTSKHMEQAMENAGITSYNSPEAAARAMATLVKYAEIKKRFLKLS